MKTSSLFSRALTRLKYHFLRLPFLSYDRIWSFLSLTPTSTRYNILNVADSEEFEKWGQKDANKLTGYISLDSIVLDFGCGIGRVSKYLAPLCKEIHGVDVSGGMVQRARKNLQGYTNAFLHKNNGRDLSIFPEAMFDFVFSMSVFQHMSKEETSITCRKSTVC